MLRYSEKKRPLYRYSIHVKIQPLQEQPLIDQRNIRSKDMLSLLGLGCCSLMKEEMGSDRYRKHLSQLAVLERFSALLTFGR